MTMPITQELVLETRDSLPSFPRVINEVLAGLDDPDANLNQLVAYIQRDPVLTARVFSQANAAANRRNTQVRDLYTATSLIGLKALRETVIVTNLAGFLKGALPPGLTPAFWEHAAATGVSAQQVAALARLPGDPALIAGLLHDIGQLWLYRHDPAAFQEAWRQVRSRSTTIIPAEMALFGIDHTIVGGWLAESWGLPPAICAAIRGHHMPDAALDEPLVAVIHVAEVLSNALDLGSGDARVPYLSAKACEQLKLTWDESAELMFGRIEAVSHFVGSYFTAPASM